MSSRGLCDRVRHHGAVLVIAALVTGGAAAPALAAPQAFPGAEGFGALVTGGRGAAVVHVTNLNDSGAGSLRDAVSAGNRTVVFDVGGLITIHSPLVIAGDNVTLAGQTAPGEGITVYGDGTSVSNRKNVIIRYLRFRQGIDSGDGTKALNVTDGSNMIFDHISVQWGRWDTIGLTGSTSSVTIQYSLLGESIDPQRFGGLVDSADKISLSHNLWLDSQSRSPKLKANGQYINNVVYNWGANGLGGGHSGADWYEDIINNYFIKGPSSTGGFATGYATTDRVFNSGNLADLDRDGQLSGRPVVAGDFQGDAPPTFEAAAHNVPPVAITVESAAAAYARVVAEAGASLCRDAVDRRLLAQVTSLGTKGAIVNDENAVGGQPSVDMVSRPAGFDSDGDGMPDGWEAAHGLNARDAADGASDSDGDGYTNLEDYLSWLAAAGPDSCSVSRGTPDGGAIEVDAAGPAATDGPVRMEAGARDGNEDEDAQPDGANGGVGTAGAAGGGGAGRGGSLGAGGGASGGAAGTAGPTDAATTNGTGAAGTPGGGCGCALSRSRQPPSWMALLLLLGLALRRKASRRSPGGLTSSARISPSTTR